MKIEWNQRERMATNSHNICTLFMRRKIIQCEFFTTNIFDEIIVSVHGILWFDVALLICFIHPFNEIVHKRKHASGEWMLPSQNTFSAEYSMIQIHRYVFHFHFRI